MIIMIVFHWSGYVDVEFGLLGVPSVGCAVGGLGKVPGALIYIYIYEYCNILLYYIILYYIVIYYIILY